MTPGVAAAAPVPPPVAAMIDAAAGDPAALKAVVDAAKKTNPDSVAEIDAQVAALAAHAEADRVARLSSQGFFQGWTGKGEAGGSVTTGNTRDTGVALGLSFAKETLRWRHAIDLSADYQRSDGVTSKQRYFAGYTGDYKISDRLFMSSVLSAEQDKFAGFRSRFTEGVGLGYRFIDSPSLKLEGEVGPALRQTDYYDVGRDNVVSVRLGGNLAWNITSTTVFTQSAAAYIDSGDTTLTATTALTTQLIGALSGRVSFDVRYESDPPPGLESTDTTSRMTLVYSFK